MKKPSSRNRDLYRSMHAGLTPRVTSVRPPPTPRALIDLRRMTAVEGVQEMGPGRVRGSGMIPYRHEFAPGTGPMIQADPDRRRNNMVLSGGSYRISNEGMIEDMARHHRIHRYYRNPEGTLSHLVMVGLAIGVSMIVADIINDMLPASWSQNKKTLASIGLDAVLILGGAALYKKHPVWGLALVGTGVAEATAMVYVRSGLKQKVNDLMHRPSSGALPGASFSGALPAGQRQGQNTAGYRAPVRVAS